MKLHKSHIDAACALHTAPARIMDWFGVSPEKVERMLASRGQLEEGKSIRETVAEHYGDGAAALLERALDDPFQWGVRP